MTDWWITKSTRTYLEVDFNSKNTPGGILSLLGLMTGCLARIRWLRPLLGAIVVEPWWSGKWALLDVGERFLLTQVVHSLVFLGRQPEGVWRHILMSWGRGICITELTSFCDEWRKRNVAMIDVCSSYVHLSIIISFIIPNWRFMYFLWYQCLYCSAHATYYGPHKPQSNKKKNSNKSHTIS